MCKCSQHLVDGRKCQKVPLNCRCEVLHEGNFDSMQLPGGTVIRGASNRQTIWLCESNLQSWTRTTPGERRELRPRVKAVGDDGHYPALTVSFRPTSSKIAHAHRSRAEDTVQRSRAFRCAGNTRILLRNLCTAPVARLEYYDVDRTITGPRGVRVDVWLWKMTGVDKNCVVLSPW